jgi:hypothetical protein
MQTRREWKRAAWVALAIGLVASPTPAGAATQIGETFEPTDNCSPRTRLQSSSPAGQYAAPFAGVITSWSFQSSSAAGDAPVRLKVARHAGGDDFTIVGESDYQAIPDLDVLNTYLVRIPIQAGDVIGLYAAPASVFYCARTATGYVVHQGPFGEDVPLGPPTAFSSIGNQQLGVSAQLEPDCDSDGLGDETQDSEIPLSEACGKGNRTLILDANKNKVKKGRRVEFTAQLDAPGNEAACESGQTIELQRKKPSQATFTTIEQLQTDATGNFTAKKKVKKTFEYRAQVPETATCAAQVSNTARVKVKKK